MKPSLLMLAVSAAMWIGLWGCGKSNNFDNPFDDPALQPPVDTQANALLAPTSFAGLHEQIFRPTCANSGCHDGTFEPDFRTIESAYATLVYQPIIKNNDAGAFEYRVLPGDASGSVLYERLVRDIDGQSGIMPLSLEPESDWESTKNTHIENIRAWISDGAKDVFGNAPEKGNSAPKMVGVLGEMNGEILDRRPGNGAILVPTEANTIRIWLAFSDDETTSSALSENTFKISTQRDDFESIAKTDLVVSSTKAAKGYFGDEVVYTHYIDVATPSQYGSEGSIIYFRAYVKDPEHDISEIPNDGSFDYIKAYFSFELE